MIFCLILITHWIADFVLQSDAVAKGKSKSNSILTQHVAIYTITFLFLGYAINLIYLFVGRETTSHVVTFALVNGILHFIIDYFTSRASAKLWAKGEVHNFFVVIGYDQLLHVLILYTTYKFILENNLCQ